MNPNKTINLDYRRLVRSSKGLDVSLHSQQIRIALLSDAATQQFIPVLKALLHENGIGAEFYEGPFDAIELETINPASGLYQFKPDFVILLNATQALRPRYYSHGLEPEFERIPRIWSAIQSNSLCRVIQCNFPLPYERPFGQFDLKLQNSFYTAVQSLNSHLTTLVRDKSNVLLCDLESVASDLGRRNWFDDRLWDMCKTFCALDHLPAAAQAMVDLVLASLGRVVKCVILDLDNTLWGGVVGDLGYAGVEIAAHGDGEAFYRFQQFLLALKNRGILLAVCSKNDLSNAAAVFESNPNMVLKRGDITVFVANWENKADNIRQIRDTLQIGFDSMVFLDDNPFERNLVRNFLPDVIVPELPEDPADYISAISRLNLFEVTAFSREDVGRSALYKEEADRREAQNSFTDINEFLKSLEMRASIVRFQEEEISRIEQLFLRSNQFNLTTHRYSEAECRSMMKNEQGCIPLQVSLQDRFGAHGLISIVVAWPQADTLFISDWLMSCRVLGRGVEQYVMNHVFAIARELGMKTVSGDYLPTAKNAMVRDFWARFGFENAGGTDWRMPVAAYLPIPVHIAELSPAELAAK